MHILMLIVGITTGIVTLFHAPCAMLRNNFILFVSNYFAYGMMRYGGLPHNDGIKSG